MSQAFSSWARYDPSEVWQPWRPSERDPWNLKWAGHLYRRAAFGASWPELQEAVKQGPDATLESLLAGKPLLAGSPDAGQFHQLMDGLAPKTASNPRYDEANVIQAWWLYGMVYTPFPLLERLTLFWHNHFATSIAKVGRPSLMLKQNRLLRKHALGKFRPFLLEMSRDPAMLLWLDSNSNVKGTPNENFARELMELFSLGVGNYTEKDIKEAARAFTGWHTAGEEFIFNSGQHDDGAKTFLKKPGNWDGSDIVRIVLDEPVAARFLVRKLFRHFISESETPPDSLIEPLAERFRQSDHDIADVLRTMLRSRLFFSDAAYRQRIKSPVEFVVGLLRQLEGRVAMTALADVMDGLGQTLFAPPNVKGWDGGKTWLNSATHLARHNVAWAFVGGDDDRFREKTDPAKLVQKHAGKESKEQVKFLLDLFVQGSVSEPAHQKLVVFAQKNKPQDAERLKRVRETAHAILLMPEYQLA